MFNKLFKVTFLLCFALLLGCSKGDQESPPPPAVAADKPASAAQAKKSDVVKIVFVGQKQACKCTKARVSKSWKALQDVLSKQPDIAVERIQLDVEEARADKLDDLRSLVVVPGLYFFDINNHLKEMLQGELTPAQISKVL